MARKIVAGNWKMNMNLFEGLTLAAQTISLSKKTSGNVEVIMSPPFIYLHTMTNMVKDVDFVKIAAQNCYTKDNGAYTGEISAEMLKSINVDYVILGHSERRKYFKEDNAFLFKKAKAVLGHGLKIIFCCGEPLEVREENNHFDYVQNQLAETIFKLNREEIKQVVIAYEPIWAIGTGKNATADQAQNMHAFIRKLVAEHYDSEVAEACSILYGGSCKPSNAKSIFSMKDVDGGLIGGASLKVDQFLQIVKSF